MMIVMITIMMMMMMMMIMMIMIIMMLMDDNYDEVCDEDRDDWSYLITHEML